MQCFRALFDGLADRELVDALECVMSSPVLRARKSLLPTLDLPSSRRYEKTSNLQ
jgi:hypothetical protein